MTRYEEKDGYIPVDSERDILDIEGKKIFPGDLIVFSGDDTKLEKGVVIYVYREKGEIWLYKEKDFNQQYVIKNPNENVYVCKRFEPIE